ncbi:MAG: helix-turn-helix domain-containing protein [Desulfobacteraceae bacterium]
MVDSIGNRIRLMRNSRGLTLKQVAEGVGCTPSYLSMVENNKLDPSASRLKKIADALGTTIVALLSDQSDNSIILRKADRQRVAVQGSRLLIDILVRQDSSKKMDARLATVTAGGGSEGNYSHPGEEFGYILKGTLDLTVDGITYTLNEGDTFYFQSTKEHCFRNRSDKDAEVLWVNHPPSW